MRYEIPNFMAICRTVAELRRFKGFSKWRYLPSWILKNPEFVTVCTVQRVIMRHYAKYRGNFSTFFQNRTDHILGFVMSMFGPLTKSIWWYLSLYKLSLESVQYSFDNTQVLIFNEFSMKISLHAPKMEVLGDTHKYT